MFLAQRREYELLKLPSPQILPVFLSGLPLREDLREGAVVFRALAHVVSSGWRG